MPRIGHIIKRDFAMYLIFHPSYPGWIWAEVDEDGETDNKILDHIISKMRTGVYTDKGVTLRCVPDIRKKNRQAGEKRRAAETTGACTRH